MTAESKTFIATPFTNEQGEVIPHLEEAVCRVGKRHWLETDQVTATTVVEENEKGLLIVENEFLRRTFSLPQKGGTEFYTISYKNRYTQQEMIGDNKGAEVYLGLYDGDYFSAYKEKCILRDPQYFYVGGASEGKTHAYNMEYEGYQVDETCEAPFMWQPHPKYGEASTFSWPPKGVKITVFFRTPEDGSEAFKDIKVRVIYEMYDGIPAMKKRVEIINEGKRCMTVGKLAPEVIHTTKNLQAQIHMETTYTCGTESTVPINTELPCGDGDEANHSPFRGLVGKKHSCYPLGPGYELQPGESFISFDTYTLLLSTYWFELKGKEIKGMYERLFPWTTDNPLTFHHTGKLTKEVIDHAAEVGFEMIIQSFGSWDVGHSKEMLTTEQETLQYYKTLIDYAHEQGVAIGMYQAQYTLGQYRNQGAEYGSNDQGTWGTWCMASSAFEDYLEKFKYFLDYTGIDCVEIDGTYPGCACGNGEKHVTHSTTYKIHKGYFDSVVKQWENAVRGLCLEMRKRGVYVKVPAWYYLNGGNKGGIGYEEVAWSQPRLEQLVYGRQIIHNSAYGKKVSQSWSHIPFVTYHGGGSDASYSPFSKNIRDYNWVLAQNIGNGVTSDYRGQCLYEDDGEISKEVLTKWVKFYKRYRGIVNSDLVAIKQADYKGTLDVLYHANAKNPGEKGLLWIYNQTDEVKTETITVPMYYTGLTTMTYPPVPVKGSLGKNVKSYETWPPNYDWIPAEEANYTLPDAIQTCVGEAVFRGEGTTDERLNIDSNGNVHLEVTLEPMSFIYYTIYPVDQLPEMEEVPTKCQVGYTTEAVEVDSGATTNKLDAEISYKGEQDGFVDLGYGVLNGCTSYEISLKFKTHGTHKQVIFSQGQEARGLATSQGLPGNYEVDDFSLVLEGTNLTFITSDISEGKEVCLKATLENPVGKWIQVCVVNCKGYYRLIINGLSVDEQKQEGMEIDTKNNLILGAIKNHAGGSYTSYFDGEIEGVRIVKDTL